MTHRVGVGLNERNLIETMMQEIGIQERLLP